MKVKVVAHTREVEEDIEDRTDEKPMVMKMTYTMMKTAVSISP